MVTTPQGTGDPTMHVDGSVRRNRAPRTELHVAVTYNRWLSVGRQRCASDRDCIPPTAACFGIQ
jgi:hypothetical protein